MTSDLRKKFKEGKKVKFRERVSRFGKAVGKVKRKGLKFASKGASDVQMGLEKSFTKKKVKIRGPNDFFKL